MEHCLKSWSERWTRNFFRRKKSCFSDQENFKSIKLLFLPPKTQLLRLTQFGVVLSLKAQYCKNVIFKTILIVEKKKPFPKISLRPEMQILVAPWDAVTTKTAVNYFSKV